MNAVRIHAYGGPEVLLYEDAPRPVVADDEVLIRVHAAGVNPVDWKVREGHLGGMLNHVLPLIPGWDVSGTVAEYGPKVMTLQTGDEVFAYCNLARNGAYAEYVAVKATEVAYKPDSLDHVQAAAVPLAALTAWQALFDLAELSAGQKVLIHAAAGGVGHFAVQLARWRGAHVIGTASGKNRRFLEEIGAHEVIDYTVTDFADAVSDVDVVLDTLSGATRDRSWPVLKKGGILVTTLPPPPAEETAAQFGVRAAFVFVQPNANELGEIAALIDSGHVRPHIDRVLPLEKVSEAHNLSQSGHASGKIVLKVAG